MDKVKDGKMFSRKIDKAQIPTCNILGVNIAAVNMEWMLNFTDKYIKVLSGDYICVSNVHTIITACEDPKYCRIQNGGVMAIPDGGPLSLVGRKQGYVQMERISGPDYMSEILRISAKKRYIHYFYGSTKETLSKIQRHLKENYPDVKIAGMYSPPFHSMTENEDATVVEEINLLKPDFIWVGLGAPKQEIWMAEHQGRVNGVMVGVGAAFDYLAGNIKRAPIWMQKLNLEWLYRLWQDPKRLIKRYWRTNIKFIWKIMIKGR